MKCKNCGHNLLKGETFCPNCGAKAFDNNEDIKANIKDALGANKIENDDNVSLDDGEPKSHHWMRNIIIVLAIVLVGIPIYHNSYIGQKIAASKIVRKSIPAQYASVQMDSGNGSLIIKLNSDGDKEAESELNKLISNYSDGNTSLENATGTIADSVANNPVLSKHYNTVALEASGGKTLYVFKNNRLTYSIQKTDQFQEALLKHAGEEFLKELLSL
ncbi:zinc-ribbon domain-containing protein [Limosilactobacillus difficilis]|uniref:zinc-ribbon domain-containing protein n=1 Tax=Limosilactobacillus difficilis TaxID=2991838 RepID=UPI0024BB6593|nr:zinc ribbon domain-containing protein [Limosilactobacillus difficilis]